jgi:hypothetical protein
MTDPLSDAPGWVRDLIAGVTEAGFSRVERSSPDQDFGDYYVTFARAETRIRVVRDRAQWRLDLTDECRAPNASGQRTWTNPARLRAVAEGTKDEGLIVESGEVSEVGWLVANLDLVASLLGEVPTWSAVDNLGRQHAMRVLGLDLPDL